jgi:hypothetical protein
VLKTHDYNATINTLLPLQARPTSQHLPPKK